jgi:hypothetical protein
MQSRIILFAGTLSVLVLGSCQSENSRNARAGSGTGGAPMTASGQLAVANPEPMDAQAAFFNGTIGVEAMLAKSDAVWKNPGASESTDRSGGGGRGGFSGGFGGGGGSSRRGGGGSGRRGGGGGETPPQTASDAGPRAPAIRASNEPPVQLRLRLTNHGDAAVEAEVLDFNSDLGNFAVQPEKIPLPSHESIEANPMTSRLGVPAVEEIPLTLRLRIGGKNGRTETQILKLRPRPDAEMAARPQPT